MKKVFLVCVAIAICFAERELKESVYEFGPFSFAPAGHGNHGPPPQLPLPLPPLPIGVKFWGDWMVVNTATNESVKETEMFLHHILIYGSGSFLQRRREQHFLSGASQDKTTWGANLPDGYLQWLPKDMTTTVAFHLLNLTPSPIEIKILYTIKYYDEGDIPDATRWVKAVELAHNYVVPGGDVAKPYVVSRTFANQDGNLTVITAQGHLHQGGIDITVAKEESSEVICTSVAKYSSNYECYYDEWCAKCADGMEPMTRKLYNDITFCTNLNVPLTNTDNYRLTASYDNSCQYNGVMAWFFLFVERQEDNL